MENELTTKFIELWYRYFNAADLPLTFYHTDQTDDAERVPAPSAHTSMIGVLAKVRNGASLRFESDSIGCHGGKRYSGFTDKINPQVEYILSCDIPEKLEGERYKKTPEIVREMVRIEAKFVAPARTIVFKRFDMMRNQTIRTLLSFLRIPMCFPASLLLQTMRN